MELKKCPKCNEYTLGDSCEKCNIGTKSAKYKFIKIRDAPKDSAKYFAKKSK
jgi:rRNA maturation protein Nop10